MPGSVRVLGTDVQKDPLAAKLKMGVIPENGTVYSDLTAEQNILITAKFFGMEPGKTRDSGRRRSSTASASRSGETISSAPFQRGCASGSASRARSSTRRRF